MSDDQSQYAVDDIDRQILTVLDADARISVRALARTIGMSAGAVGERLEKMQSAGVVRGYRVDMVPARLGYGIEVIAGLELTQGSSIQETIEALLDVPEIRNVYLVTGRWDVMIYLMVKNQAELRRLLLDVIWGVPNFRRSETLVVMESHRSRGTLSKLLFDE
jgi:DNA-binding Lrp family transcriptional regulator